MCLKLMIDLAKVHVNFHYAACEVCSGLTSNLTEAVCDYVRSCFGFVRSSEFVRIIGGAHMVKQRAGVNRP